VLVFQSLSGLQIEASTTASDGVLDQFYQDYDAAFVLPNEKEGRDGFAECLALNAPPAYEALAARFGPFREFVLIARDGASGPRIGGANFIAFPLQEAGEASAKLLSLNLNYVFINTSVRRQGYLKRLVRDLPDIALTLLAATNGSDVPGSWTASGRTSASPPRTLIFIEQNDPYRMSRDEYEQDTKYTGLDQVARIGIWSRLGARIVDFPYVQPPLSANQAPDTNLVLAVLGLRADSLDPCVLHDHLERFFAISVLKGADPLRQPEAAKQLVALGACCNDREHIALLAADRLDQGSARLWDATIPKPPSLRALLVSPVEQQQAAGTRSFSVSTNAIRGPVKN
jgi:hypothetical protein